MHRGKVSPSSAEHLETKQSRIRAILREYSENSTVHCIKYTSPESGRGGRAMVRPYALYRVMIIPRDDYSKRGNDYYRVQKLVIF